MPHLKGSIMSRVPFDERMYARRLHRQNLLKIVNYSKYNSVETIADYII